MTFLWVPLFLAVIMTTTWLFAKIRDNASWVDVSWAFSLTCIGTILCGLGNGDPTRRIVFGTFIFFWGGRLTWHIAQRVIRHPEEGRYLTLRKDWEKNFWLKMLVFFHAQGFANWFLSIPFFFIATQAGPFALKDVIACVLLLISLSGEAIADAQLERFKSTAKKGEVCQSGLWAWSRHPNYFFEWITWLGFALAATSIGWSYLAWLAPAVMLIFLTRITGIPPTEEQCIKSKGDAYRQYQKTTSIFFPLPPKKLV